MIAISTKAGLEKIPFFTSSHTHHITRGVYILETQGIVCVCVCACARAHNPLCLLVCGCVLVCAGVPLTLTVLWKVLLSLFRLVSGSPSPLDVANPSFNANDCHLESNASLIAAHCLINVKCCVKKYIASL